MKKKYRLYVDEVGNSGLGSFSEPNDCYLSLTGVILDLEYTSTTVFPTIEGLKRDYFESHPDEPVILHRKELVNKKYPFHNLSDQVIEEAFNQRLLDLLQNLDYAVITVVIDKLAYNQHSQVRRLDLYHYCTTTMVEQYVLCLKSRDAIGDVMAESRGGKEDQRLKVSFEEVYTHGSDSMKPEMFVAHLTSKQLKMKLKGNNIAGLQLADIIAHPSFRATLARRDSQPLADNFGGKIAEILEASKYVRDLDGQIDGWGRRWLP